MSHGIVFDKWKRRFSQKSEPSIEINANWYCATYPLVKDEIAQGRAASVQQHYQRFGRDRGYLSSLSAERPSVEGGTGNRFGGLWLDRPDAETEIARRLGYGQLTAIEAEQLRSWVKYGFVILEKAIPDTLIESALRVAEAVYAGKLPQARFESVGGTPGPAPWTPEVCLLPAKALDLHWLSEEIRAIAFAPALVRFLNLLFERKPFLSQSLTFMRGSAQSAHQDTAYVAYSIPRQFAASWVALENVTVGAGELIYYPGSHRLPDFLYAGRFKSIPEANRMKAASFEDISQEESEHVASLPRIAAEHGLAKRTFLARKGDVLFWHPDLAHGGGPVSKSATRWSIVSHYCPSDLVPYTFEHGRTQLRHEGSVGQYTANAY